MSFHVFVVYYSAESKTKATTTTSASLLSFINRLCLQFSTSCLFFEFISYVYFNFHCHSGYNKNWIFSLCRIIGIKKNWCKIEYNVNEKVANKCTSLMVWKLLGTPFVLALLTCIWNHAIAIGTIIIKIFLIHEHWKHFQCFHRNICTVVMNVFDMFSLNLCCLLKNIRSSSFVYIWVILSHTRKVSHCTQTKRVSQVQNFLKNLFTFVKSKNKYANYSWNSAQISLMYSNWNV